MKSLNFYCTRYDWGFGFEFSIPSISKEFFQRTKLRIPFGFTVYFGPWTMEMRPEPEIVAFQCAVCIFEHTGAPAFIGPVPGMVICSGCQEHAAKTGETLQVHADDCDGDCGVDKL